MPDPHELVIVGSGPAGLTAAVYAGRANLNPIVIEGIGAGGQLKHTTDVENYPGFPDGILGPELMMKFREQAERFGAEFITADADRVDVAGGGPFGVWVGEREFRGHSMIITTGASARMLGLPSEQRLLGHGVSTWVRMWRMSSSASVRWKRLSIVRTMVTNGVPLSVISASGMPHSSMASPSVSRTASASLVGMARMPST